MIHLKQNLIIKTGILFFLLLLSLLCLAAENYFINPGDILQISVWKEDNLNRELMVRPDGKFSFPLVGEVETKGLTVEQVNIEITERLEKFIPDPEVSISIQQIVGNKIYVIGKVNRPGEFVMNHDIDVMQALSMAGGTTTFAGLNKIKILRREGDKQIAIPFQYADVERGKNLEQNIILQRGDIVVVP
jgi:polysaccharide biosynthesis/export protein